MEKEEKPLKIVQDDPWLTPYNEYLTHRLSWYHTHCKYIDEHCNGLDYFTSGHKYFGFNYDTKEKGWWFREYAPNATSISLIGDFNTWNGESHPLKRLNSGTWEIFLDDKTYQQTLLPFSKVKIRITSDNGTLDRIPAYIYRAVQDKKTFDFSGQFVPESTYHWQTKKFTLPKKFTPYIYEAHPGMATQDGHVGSWREFADNIIPRIASLGYNTVQLMAVQEHPYYGSFGYHVSNFFAPSSRFGTPDDLRYLIDTAHGLGIAVVMDLVHSHAVKNIAEGLSEFDGKKELYFVDGPSGIHPGWDSKLFDYGKMYVQQFLLSNIKYWTEEFHFDGFRFDGVTSMLYYHHGNVAFSSYDSYFGKDTNNSAVLYLQMANTLIKKMYPTAISIAEDMSGMPGACVEIEDGGLGFTHRLAMGLPDYWIRLLSETKDEDWDMDQMYHCLVNRRHGEANIAYDESHDQALVGDKTIAFWLMDKEMYSSMSVFVPSQIIDRGIALHKMIRFITLSLGGEGYLNFMGNEFGHPEWIDFPREGNGWSTKYARRQWNLPDTDHLRYKFLQNFDSKMIHFSENEKIPSLPSAQLLNIDNTNKVIIFSRGAYVFIFSFSPGVSIEDYEFFVPKKGKYKIIFSSDSKDLGGFDRVKEGFIFETFKKEKDNFLSIYLPSRMCMVLKKE
ncbi:MAG: alpha amylase C-terminal domain-containing protein [Flavobacteriales bacterium]|nr:alpha amylase C-terminal domain-containing protein [Flavobacteriales bacterium]